jgi:D-mannonate dehydratase
MCVDDEKRLLADFDVHQVQLDLQQMKANMSNVEQTIQQLTSSGISTFYYQFMYISCIEIKT